MRRILIFGASGRVGLRLIEYALADLQQVTAFVRNKEKVNISHPNLNILTGDVLNREEVESAIQGQDLIISSLSGRATKPDYSVLSIGIQNILSGMKKLNVNRLLNVAGAGILDDKEYGLRRNRPNYPEIFRNVSAENWKVYELLQKSSIHWTMVCAPEMPEGDRTGVYRTLSDFLPDTGRRISTGDVADFILKNLENKSTFQKRIGIAY